jgi:hypothetical protein
MCSCFFGARDVVDERGGEQRIKRHAPCAAIALTTVRPALIADFVEVGVNCVRGAGGAHARNAAFHVPNGN